MTYIELYDEAAIENVCACLAKIPSRVILIGDRIRVLKRHALRCQQLLAERGHEVEFICRSINKNDMECIIQVLSDLVNTYEGCVLDLTGGGDLYLVAAGIVCERFKEKGVKTNCFNVRQGTIIDSDCDGITIMENYPLQLTVEENVRIYGGDIVYEDVKKDGTYRWDLNEEFKQDILAMWDICKNERKRWNNHISVLDAAAEMLEDCEPSLTLRVAVEELVEYLRKKGRRFQFSDYLLKKLKKIGVVTNYRYDKEVLSVTFKDEQVKRCLTKAGQVLEMFVFLSLKELKEKDGTSVYSDVMNGVQIDWDGEIHTEEDQCDTENEIDIMVMHGILPMFISCKNGRVEVEELYKLNTVANEFGGQYAKKVLIAPALTGKGEYEKYFYQRAKDMGIRLVDDIQEKKGAELEKLLKNLWN